MTKKLKKKPSKLKPEKVSLTVGFLTETPFGLLYLETPINRLAKTILALRKQLRQVELEESENQRKGEI